MSWYIGCKIPKPRNRMIRDMNNLPNALGDGLNGDFFDGGAEELLTCHAILDQIALHDAKSITIRFDKEFLKKILKSHIRVIRKV